MINHNKNKYVSLFFNFFVQIIKFHYKPYRKMKDFSEKLKKALKDKKLSQKALSQKIEMSEVGFSNMISNNSLKVETLEKICEVLDVPISYFLDIEPEKVEPVGFWKKMIQDMSDEMNNLRMRAYRAEELLSKNGLGNFSVVSERRGVLNVAKNRKNVFFRPNSLRFHLHN